MRKQKEIGKAILRGILIGGAVAVAATSPYFVPRIMPKIIQYAKYKIRKRKQLKNFYRSFYYLKKQGMVKVEYRGKQIYISLTGEGKKMAGRYQIDDMVIKRPKKWDKKWRMLIFDIEEKHKVKREALRGKLKELGFYKLQDSVWVYPYSFQNEAEILRIFFNLTPDEMKVIIASEIEKDEAIRSFFDIN